MDKVILTNTLDDGAQIVPAPELEFVDNANEVISKAFSAASYHFHGYNPVKEAYYRGVEYTIKHLPEIVTGSSLEAFCNTVLGNNNAIAARRNALIEKFCFSSFSDHHNPTLVREQLIPIVKLVDAIIQEEKPAILRPNSEEGKEDKA